ncbi:MAG: Crp/Fnr family transcriptional regulator [Ancalomicrobiaceae bacterium]|nr:Crp/Fnr family transcriptional regulator [Ancalomicrobiaceae bacterium]
MAELDPATIADTPLFQGLSTDVLRDILHDARSYQVPRGEAVFAQGDEPDSFFLLLNGHLQVVKITPAGQQVVVRYVAAGEIFGVAVALGMRTYPASVVATVDSVVIRWPSSAWGGMIQRCPPLAANMLQWAGSHITEAHTRVVEMSTEQVEKRVAHAILRLLKQSGKPTKEGVEIAFPISRQDVAEMTGTTLHTVSRTLSAWERDGIVESGRQRIVVRDAKRLAALAEE